MHNNGPKIIIAGGKTGGHLFPGIAIAEAIRRQRKFSEILFVGTGEKFEVTTLERYGFPHTKISCTGIKGKSIKEKLKSVLHIPVSIVQAIKIIKNFNPDIVIGVGGYSSGPVVLGARLCGVMTAIHEQNSIPGLTNRILSRFVHVIFISFENTKGFSKTKLSFYFGNPVRRPVNHGLKNENITGNRIRIGIGTCAESKNENTINNKLESGTETMAGKTETGESKGRLTILVTGGSQGASSINRAFLDAVKLMKHPEYYNIIHQTGRDDEESVIMEYEKMGVKAKVGAFFYNMPFFQDIADLIVCRAGAGTLSEISAKGKPSILIPYPHAANDHQQYNAEFFAEKGAAWVMKDSEITGHGIKEKIEFAENNPENLASMACAAKSLSMPCADDNIALKCIQMAEKKGF